VIRITKTIDLHAAHYLRGYAGKCANMHGHTYKFEVTIQRQDHGLDGMGMVLDFGVLNGILKDAIVDKIDHQVLNEVLPMQPTAENTALWAMEALAKGLEPYGCQLVRIRVWETPTAFAEVSNDAVICMES
jgi:6-pyruvoyltetrahydropterin/6-carboxytetrahydropterin synthase